MNPDIKASIKIGRAYNEGKMVQNLYSEEKLRGKEMSKRFTVTELQLRGNGLGS